MQKDRTGSFFNYLPEGCRLCRKGAKMVLFVTGLCGKNCFYCPVSGERKERDSVFANETRIEKDDDLIQVAETMDALGTGITGGEPLLQIDRVIHYIKLLKNRFGKTHHIHLYTGLSPQKVVLGSLKSAGLDEIRFHPSPDLWKNISNSYYSSSIRWAHDLGLLPGIEIPSIASDFSGIVSILEEVDGFLNLNELEFSETNKARLEKLEYLPLGDISSAAKGSKEIAESVKGRKIHFCSSRFKDAIQLRERFKRIAKNTARDFDEITDDGTLVYGVIEGGDPEILEGEGVTEDMYAVVNNTLETAWWIASDLAGELKKIGLSVWVIERYPMNKGMIVEKTPL
jgi:pyruvate formate-lyase activating enzyme-like uncharacterized protein